MKQRQGREGEERKELFSGPPLVVGGVHEGREISSLAGWERKWSSSVYFSPFLSQESRSKERGGRKKSPFIPLPTPTSLPHIEKKRGISKDFGTLGFSPSTPTNFCYKRNKLIVFLFFFHLFLKSRCHRCLFLQVQMTFLRKCRLPKNRPRFLFCLLLLLLLLFLLLLLLFRSGQNNIIGLLKLKFLRVNSCCI